MNSILDQVRKWSNENPGVLRLAGVVLTAVGIAQKALTPLFPSAPQMITFFARFGPIVFWAGVVFLAAAVSVAWRQQRRRLAQLEETVQILEALPETLLDQTTAANLSNWSFGSDQWALDEHGLSVTRSPFGGVCKIGASWENYQFTFDFKIIHHCAAWIVRASATRAIPSRYVMIQCRGDRLRPHVFFTRQVSDDTLERGFQVLTEIDHHQSPVGWNKAKTTVLGHSIKVWINNELVWSNSELLKDFPTGTVGFRSSGREHALFRNIKVQKQ